MAFTCTIAIENSIARLTLGGELDAAAAAQFRDRIEEAAAQQPKALVLMLQDLSSLQDIVDGDTTLARQRVDRADLHPDAVHDLTDRELRDRLLALAESGARCSRPGGLPRRWILTWRRARRSGGTGATSPKDNQRR